MDTTGHIDSGELPPGSHHTQLKLFSRFLFQTQTISLWLQGALKMIARLSSAVFYIITRKILGAFYVDQKKKGLLPSTLLSEHEQWGTTGKKMENITFPIAFSSTKNVILLINPYHSDGSTHPSDGWSTSVISTTMAHCSLTGYDLRFIACGD